MNQAAVDVLVQAALDGTPQVYGQWSNGRGGFCVNGLLGARLGFEKAGLMERDVQCPECGQKLLTEGWRTMHCNDVHRWDWLTLARKLGPTA